MLLLKTFSFLAFNLSQLLLCELNMSEKEEQCSEGRTDDDFPDAQVFDNWVIEFMQQNQILTIKIIFLK